MLRVVFFLVLVGLLAAAAAWFAERPGEVAITWQGWRIDTSVAVLVALMALIAVFAVMIWSTLRAIVRAPQSLRFYMRSRRGVKGYLAVSQGLVAVGSGDARAARRFAEDARRIAPDQPLTLLLTAQSAQLAGDHDAAEQTFRAMAARDDTRLLGLHGLFTEARQRQDAQAAQIIAEEAAAIVPAPPWAGHAALEFRCMSGDWTGALERLDRNLKSGLVDKGTHRRQRAVLLTARALALVETDRAGARNIVLEAVKLAPTLVPAAALAARILAENGEQRKAGRIIEAAWQANPHPDLADVYARLRQGDSARDRLKRIEYLAQKAPGQRESAIAVARAALDAHEFGIARAALAPLTAAPTRRVALLMAELEEREHGDSANARVWMTRAVHAPRDAAWTADGLVSERWMPVSPVTGRLDSLEWSDPLAELAPGVSVFETGLADSPLIAPPRSERPDPEPTTLDVTPVEPPTTRSMAEVTPLPTQHRARPTMTGAPAPADKVIPLVHAPDDPGPDSSNEAHSQPPKEPWRRMFT